MARSSSALPAPAARAGSRLTLLPLLALLGGGLAWAGGPPAHKPESAAPKAAEAPPAKTAEAAPGKAAKAAPVDAMDQLRERLAEKLGAARPPESRNPNVLRVATRMDPPPAEAPRGTVAAPRKPSTAVLAALDSHRPPDKHAAVPQPQPAAAPHAAHWAYTGETGPAAWGGLKPEFATCAKGQRQSPIDIRGGIAVDLEPVHFDYRASSFGVIDNGHTVQVNVPAGNSIRVGGRSYELVQFHFHRPSEERIDGRQFDMSVHLVHKDPEGRLAVVGLLLERGTAQPVVQHVWNNLPLEKGEEAPAQSVLDLNHLLPPDRGYYTYMGSLTTPPCSEGVLWMVMRQPVAVSPQQIDIFARLYPMNARPVQTAAGRLIKQSQ